MGVRCIVVDDSDHFRELARSVLERDGIAVVGVASDGSQALELVNKLQPDIALIDICLGDECGIKLTRLIAERSHGKGPAVILISTYAEDEVSELVAGSTALEFLPKLELSGETIRDILGRGGGEPRAVQA
jgi:CheY-like chemotaxis protein